MSEEKTIWNKLLLSSINQKVKVCPKIQEAFLKVERHRLIKDLFQFLFNGQLKRFKFYSKNPSDEIMRLIYSDESFATFVKDGKTMSSTSQPSLMAHMLQLLDLKYGLKVMEIGTGIGYNTALLSELVGQQNIITVDILTELLKQTKINLRNMGYERVIILERDGYFGSEEYAPYDRIIATVGCPDISPHWIRQLKKNGMMLIPILHRIWQPLMKIWLDGNKIKGKVVGHSGFLPIYGQLAEIVDNNDSIKVNDYSKWEKLQLPISLHNIFSIDRLWAGFFPIDFLYYLTISDYKRTFYSLSNKVFGLYDEKNGIALISPREQSIFLKGSIKIYDTLKKHLMNWIAYGKPKPNDFESEFYRKDQFKNFDSKWSCIERKYFIQIVRLKC